MTSPPPLYSTPRNSGRPTYGPRVATIARAFGHPFMPWQRRAVNLALEVNPATGRLVHSLVVISVQRQAGKTTLIRPVCMEPMMTRRDASTWLTAQRRNDARDTWLETIRAVERSPLSGAFKTRLTNGSESLTFRPTYGELRLFAPQEEALHGKTTHRVMVDEGWAFSADRGEQLMQAILPTQVTVTDAQVWILSTAGTARSEWLRAFVDAGRAACLAGEDPGFCFIEYGMPDDADTGDLAEVARAHPAYGHTIDMDALRRAQAVMSPAAFARAYGNRWTAAIEYLIDPLMWDHARTVAKLERSPMALCVETSTDGIRTAIIAAGVAEGVTAVEVVETRPGTAGTAARILELNDRFAPAAVVIDPHSPAAPIMRELDQLARGRRVMPPLLPVTAGDYVEAWAQFLEGLGDGTIRHRSHRLFDAACEVASTRMVREQRVLSRTGAAELVAAMLAVHGLRNPPVVLRPKLMVARAPETGT